MYRISAPIFSKPSRQGVGDLKLITSSQFIAHEDWSQLLDRELDVSLALVCFINDWLTISAEQAADGEECIAREICLI